MRSSATCSASRSSGERATSRRVRTIDSWRSRSCTSSPAAFALAVLRSRFFGWRCGRSWPDFASLALGARWVCPARCAAERARVCGPSRRSARAVRAHRTRRWVPRWSSAQTGRTRRPRGAPAPDAALRPSRVAHAVSWRAGDRRWCREDESEQRKSPGSAVVCPDGRADLTAKRKPEWIWPKRHEPTGAVTSRRRQRGVTADAMTSNSARRAALQTGRHELDQVPSLKLPVRRSAAMISALISCTSSTRARRR